MDLQEIIAHLATLSDADKQTAIDEATGMTSGMKWIPSPGPQTDAYFSKADILLYGGEPGGGKGLSISTPLPTPWGWVTMSEVSVGDWLIDDAGQPCQVTAVSPVNHRRCFELRFSDGETLISDDVHRWVTRNRRERLRAWGSSPERREARKATRPPTGSGKRPDIALRNASTAKTKGLPLSSMRDTLEIFGSITAGKDRRLNHSIDVAKPLVLPEQDLLIDPYVLGAWLGDGNSSGGVIHGIDEEVFTEVANNYSVTRRSAPVSRGVLGLQKHLRQLGLLNNKHIPAVYLRASTTQRQALLQGLMDTDGYCDLRGQCEITLTRKVLIDGIRELLATLGIKVCMRESEAKLNGRVTGPRYRLKFITEMSVFRLPRKLIRQKRSGFRGTHGVRYIESVTEVPSVPTKCIQVDSPSRLYLAGSGMIPTHNTSLLLGLAFNNHRRSLIMRKQYTDLGAIVDEAIKFHGSRKGYNGSPPPSLRVSPTKFIEFGAAARVGDEEHWQGNPHDLICVGKGTPVLMADGSYKAIEAITPGDRIQTLEGPRAVQKTFAPQYKKAVEVTTPFGSQIQSEEHALLTAHGWVSSGMCGAPRPHGFFSPKRCRIFRVGAKPFLALRASLSRLLVTPLAGQQRGVLTAALYSKPQSVIPRGKETCACVVKPIPESAGVGSYELRQGTLRLLLSNALLRLQSLFFQADLQCCSPGCASACGARDAHGRSSLADYSVSCSDGFRLYDARTPAPLNPYSASADGQLYLHQSYDAGLPSPRRLPVRVPGQIRRCTRHKLRYDHPYSSDKRQASESVFSSPYQVTKVGVKELYDLQVADVCHYITRGGFVNKNCFDEGTQFVERQIRFLMGWLRCADDPNQRTRVVIATNPPLSSEGLWVIEMFAPWLDPRHPNPAKTGELRYFVTDENGEDQEVKGPDPVEVNGKKVKPLSRTFIPASVNDNPYLASTSYQAQLDAMVEPFRSVLMGGFRASFRDDENQCIPVAWVQAAQQRWTPSPRLGVPMCAIGADVAQGGIDETVLAPRYDDWFAPMSVKPGRETPLGTDVAGFIVANRKDSAPVVLDMGGGYGGATYECLLENEIEVIAYKGAAGVDTRTADRQLKFVNKRTEAYWRLREALDPSQEGGATIMLPDDPKLTADLTAPHFKVTKQGIALETKEDVCKRLGRSTDRGDAVVMAWSYGPKFMSDGGEWMAKRESLVGKRLHGKGGPKVVMSKNARGRR